MNTLHDIIDRHPGQTCWIIGTGPSLDALDDAELRGPRILIHRAAFALPRSAGETYWMVVDDCWGLGTPGPWHDTLSDVRLGTADMTGCFRHPLLSGSGPVPAPEGPNILHWTCQREHAWRLGLLTMTREELADGGWLYQHCGSAAPSIHLAWLMGCTRVVLVGIDGTDGHARRLAEFYTDRPRKGGLGYMTSKGDAHLVADRLGLEVEDRSAGAKT